MRFGNKLLIGALTLLAGAGFCEYNLYKKFEHSPNPIREVARWPYNDVWTESDHLTEKFETLKNIELKSVSGRISSLNCLEGLTNEVHGGRTYYSVRRVDINFVEMSDEQKFVYTGNFFAGKGDIVTINVLPIEELSKLNDFLSEVNQFRSRYPTWLWTTKEYDFQLNKFPNIRKSIENIPLTKLSHLEGIIENYQIIEDN